MVVESSGCPGWGVEQLHPQPPPGSIGQAISSRVPAAVTAEPEATSVLSSFGQERIIENDNMLHLPTDIIQKILFNVTDPASLACLTLTCKFLRNIIMDPSFLDCLRLRRHDHGFAPSLLLGFFNQEWTESPLYSLQRETGKWCCLAPRFMPTSSFSFIVSKGCCGDLTPVTLDPFLRRLGGNLNFCKSIASQDGFLALSYHSKGSQAEPDRLYVCNPLTGDIFYIPKVQGEQPDQYALLVTEEVSPKGWTSQSFKLVAIWVTGKSICGFRSYSSKICGFQSYSLKDKRWAPSGPLPALLPGLDVVLSPVAASHRSINFLCGNSINWTLTHVVTLHVDTGSLSYLELPLAPNCSKGHLLGNSADGGLLLLLLEDLQLSLWKHDGKLGSDSNSWVLSETIDLASSLPLQVVQMRHRSRIMLDLFLGKSGAVVLRVEGEGLFLFSLGDRSTQKICDENHAKKYSLCPYEIDYLSCLDVMNLVIDIKDSS